MIGLEPLTPAYGRDYEGILDLIEDFRNDKDFRTPLRMGIARIRVRFFDLTETDIIDVLDCTPITTDDDQE